MFEIAEVPPGILQIIVMVKTGPFRANPQRAIPSGADGQDSATAPLIRRSGGVHTFRAQELQTATASADPQPTFTVLICRDNPVGREEVGPAKAERLVRGSWPQAKQPASGSARHQPTAAGFQESIGRRIAPRNRAHVVHPGMIIPFPQPLPTQYPKTAVVTGAEPMHVPANGHLRHFLEVEPAMLEE